MSRLYDEFQKKNIASKVGGMKNFKSANNSNDEICIAIPLKNSTNGKP